MRTQPSLSYAASSASSDHGGVYQLHDDQPHTSTDDVDELLMDPSCHCCCSCSRRAAGEKGTCCSWLNLLIIFACAVFCLMVGAVIYSVTLMDHILGYCRTMKALFVAIPIICGLFWISGVSLFVRSFKFRRHKYQQELMKAAIVHHDMQQIDTPLTQPQPRRCTRRRVARVTISATFWFIFVVLNLVILGVFSALVYFELNTLPKTNGTIHVGDGLLSATATIGRTDENILHITSTDPNSFNNSNYDLFFTQGIAHAQERLWQMEFQRAVGSGRLGELTGLNDAVVKIDKLARTMNFYGHAQESLAGLTARSQQIIRAYCDGVNAYLSNKALRLPIEFIVLGLDRPRDWVPADVLVWTKIVSYMLSGNLDNELQRWDLLMLLNVDKERIDSLLPKYDATKFPIILEGEIPDSDMSGHNHSKQPKREPIFDWLATPTGQAYKKKMAKAAHGGLSKSTPFAAFRKMFGPSTASNNWVISGNRTKSGKPIMANDPHLQLMAPSIWILNRLSSPSFTAIGASFVGVPGVIIGHNNDISWSVTNVGADVQDLFIMDELNHTHYKHNNKIYEYTIRREVISVKHDDDIVMDVREASQYGPVISDLGTSFRPYDLSNGPSLALRWTSLDSTDTTFDAFLLINTATNWNEFQSALRYYRAPSQNMIYADRDGNIGYTTTGVVPIRPDDGTGLYPTPGTGEYDWEDEWVDFDDMPRVLNPKKGYIATANNAVVPDGYKVYITGDWDSGSDGYRAKRITDMITGTNSATGKPASTTPLHTVDTVKQMQSDVLSGVVLDFQNHIFPLLEPETVDGKNVLSEWKAWDGNMDVGSVNAQRFERFFLALQSLPSKEVNQSRWSDAMWLLYTFTGKVDDPNCDWTGSAATQPTCLQFASSAVDRIASLGVESQRWGLDCHSAKYVHQVLGASPLACMANRKVAHGGDHSTINVGSVDIDNESDSDTDGLLQTHGSSYRHIIDWADVENNSEWIFGPGQSGNLFSTNYDDLVPLWANGQYLSMSSNAKINNELTIEA